MFVKLALWTLFYWGGIWGLGWRLVTSLNFQLKKIKTDGTENDDYIFLRRNMKHIFYNIFLDLSTLQREGAADVTSISVIPATALVSVSSVLRLEFPLTFKVEDKTKILLCTGQRCINISEK